MRFLRKAWEWFDARTDASKIIGPVMNHPVPPGTGWKYVFGSATLFAFLIQVFTGIALATAFVPSAGQAYESLQWITHEAFLGRLLRGMHYFGASAMVLLVGIHMIRTFLTGSYKFPRELNWVVGVVLLGLTILMGFTGQLLRWDQNGVWSTIVAAEQAGRVPVIGAWLARLILGGQTVGGATLSRFFAYHVFFIPAVIFAMVGLHLALVLRHGISELPDSSRPVDPRTYRSWYENMLRREGVPFWPDAAWRDVVFGAAVVACVVVLAWRIGPPLLTKPPDPTIIEAYPRPDWYLLWYFAVLAQLPPGTENYVIVGAPVLAGFCLLILPLLFNKGQRAPSRRPWAVASMVIIAMSVGVLWYQGKRSPWSPDFGATQLPAHVVQATDPQIAEGARLFFEKGCQYCHAIAGSGGQRGPDLTYVADKLTEKQITLRILNGAFNMPSFASSLKPDEASAIVAFLDTRKLPH
ncbi:MAG: cytochrome b N-terminal domain-containing protein [Bryobacterales bacterium]|nr:cytochrome b N-terminal domain-containing protein [Bryobacterales bacterium]MBV9399722.1 cytochrome b N-terminal domain-containing protein [Bryobacterales bacterium]